MKFVVCIKQVPVMASLAFDPETRTLRREGVRSEVSAFDLRAVAKAVDLREELGGEVVVVTMGPQQAREALVDCLALGADRAVHLQDRAFAGADTLATSRALAAAIAREQPDVILCGRYSVDAETSQVGPQVAHLLGLPQITQAQSLTIDPATREVEAVRLTDDGSETLRGPLPVLVTATEDLAAERFPSKAERQAAAERPITVLTATDLGVDPGSVGAAGSPTWVADLLPVESSRRQILFAQEDGTADVETLADRLVAEHDLFGTLQVPEFPRPAALALTAPPSGPRDVWVVVEPGDTGIHRVGHELLSRGRALADALGGSLVAMWFGEVSEPVRIGLEAYGVEEVMAGPDSGGPEGRAALLEAAIRQRSPRIVLLPSTTWGRDIAPRVAAGLGIGLTGDCIDLGLDAEGRLRQYKPTFGGLVLAPILSRTFPEMATVRPGVFEAEAATSRGPLRITFLPPAGVEERMRSIAVQSSEENSEELDQADVVLGLGMGVAGGDLGPIRELGALLSAPLCTTRDVVDEGGWPRHLQIGLTGRAIAPKLYFAIGIRGAYEHMVGVRRAGLIVAINKSARAPVFRQADYGLVGDAGEIVPALTAALRRRRPGG